MVDVVRRLVVTTDGYGGTQQQSRARNARVGCSGGVVEGEREGER
jgi:hypothetical protein